MNIKQILISCLLIPVLTTGYAERKPTQLDLLNEQDAAQSAAIAESAQQAGVPTPAPAPTKPERQQISPGVKQPLPANQAVRAAPTQPTTTVPPPATTIQKPSTSKSVQKPEKPVPPPPSVGNLKPTGGDNDGSDSGSSGGWDYGF